MRHFPKVTPFEHDLDFDFFLLGKSRNLVKQLDLVARAEFFAAPAFRQASAFDDVQAGSARTFAADKCQNFPNETHEYSSSIPIPFPAG